jgi:MoaA/NifB/PqqE/SkfB family radical SAM enzyme
VLFVTGRCNAACGHCFSAGVLDKGEELRLEEYAQVAASMGPLVQVVFSGGEPFLRGDLPEIAALFYSLCRPAVFSVPTNGASPESILEAAGRMAQACPKARFNFLVSLDGLSSVHDRLRGRTGLFDSALETLRGLQRLSLSEKNVRALASTAVLAENLEAIEPLSGFLSREFGPEGPLQVLQLDERAQCALYREEGLLERARAVLERSSRARRLSGPVRRGLARMFIDGPNRWVLERTAPARRPVSCGAGQRSVVILPDGSVFPCEPFAFSSLGGGGRAPKLRDFQWDMQAVLGSCAYRQMAREVRCCARPCAWSCAGSLDLLYSPWRRAF